LSMYDSMYPISITTETNQNTLLGQPSGTAVIFLVLTKWNFSVVSVANIRDATC
jgi:hypothetical protein